MRFPLLLASFGCLAISNAGYAVDVLSPEQQVREVSNRLIGVMSTAEQSAANPKIANVQMTTCAVSVKGVSDPKSVYLYQEQAINAAQNSGAAQFGKPYRQRFLQLSPNAANGSVRSLSFRPAEATRWIGLCNRPESARVVQLQDVGKPTCAVFLKQSGDAYIGRTPINGCPSNVRGAVRVTNYIELERNRMNTYDRGYDANGKQVWGAKEGAYQFKKI
ncbi:MAG: chromophore lyase CpcT/CpeT [Myxacorys californica WJT36-NPBG1]|jgi:hypothetical protein|nr:chromophore lyase CpcT/CpeT [Myxacorys californica WJT36-NPBG1]